MIHGKKTYLAALAAVLTAWGGYFAGSLDFAAAVQATVTAVLAATLRHGITTRAAFLLPLACAVLLLPSCESVSVSPFSGVCVQQQGYRACYNPLTESGTVQRTDGTGGVQTLTYDRPTRTWRATWPDGSALVYDEAHGFRTEPPLPDKPAK